jgi:CBS domain containing-hemolysin-like protein
MALLLIYLSVALVVSFLCSLLESVLLTITPSYMEAEEQKGNKIGPKLKKIKIDIDRPLAAILSLNTIAHTVGAAGVGAQAVKIYGDTYMGLISGILTFLILVFSEILPKTIGVTYWRKLTPFTAYVLDVLIVIMYPFVLISKWMTALLSSGEKQPLVSRSEIYAMADMGQKEGVFIESESRILKNLVRLRILKVEDIMTPRTVVIAAPENWGLKKIYDNEDYFKFSRIPVFDKNIDNVTGYVHKHDVLDKLAKDAHKIPLKDIKRDIAIAPEEMSIMALFEKFIAEKEQIALVVDKYGGMAGIVTMEDVMETLLGLEIMDEYDSTRDMQEYAREKWRERAEKLGIITANENYENLSNQREESIQYGLTGGTDPFPEERPDEPAAQPTEEDNKPSNGEYSK